jgi:hypothetical protein
MLPGLIELKDHFGRTEFTTVFTHSGTYEKATSWAKTQTTKGLPGENLGHWIQPWDRWALTCLTMSLEGQKSTDFNLYLSPKGTGQRTTLSKPPYATGWPSRPRTQSLQLHAIIISFNGFAHLPLQWTSVLKSDSHQNYLGSLKTYMDSKALPDRFWTSGRRAWEPGFLTKRF